MNIGDRLSRRVKRHSQFGVLFRMPEEDAFRAVTPRFDLPAATPLQLAEYQESLPVLAEIAEMDTLLELQEQGEAVPDEPMIEPDRKPASPPKPSTQMVKMPPPPKVAAIQRTPLPKPAPVRQPQPAKPVQPPVTTRSIPDPNAQLPAIPPDMPQGEPKEEKVKISEADWQRLQTIMRKHREKADVEQQPAGETIDQPGAFPAESAPSKSSEDQPKAAQEQIRGSVQAQEIKGTPSVPATKPERGIFEIAPDRSNQPLMGKSVNEKNTQRPLPAPKIQEMDSESDKPLQTKSFDQPILPSDRPTSHVRQIDRGNTEPIIDQDKPQPVEAAIPQSVQASSEWDNTRIHKPGTKDSENFVEDKPAPETVQIPAIQEQRAKSQEMRDGSDLIQEETEQNFVGEGRINPVPLDQVWPIQKKDVDFVNQAIQKSASSLSFEEPLPLVEAGHGEEVRQILSAVKPAQSTDTPVEVITPRRVRPPLQSVQRTSKIDQPSSVSPPHASQVEEPIPSRPPQKSEMIPTKIGPLPADLWELMGQSPPQVQRSFSESGLQVPAPERVEQGEEKDNGQSSSILIAENEQDYSPERNAQQIPSEVSMQSLQRSMAGQEKKTVQPAFLGVVQEAEESESANQPADGGAAAGRTGNRGQSDQENEQKVEELAKKVYSEIKRRLIIEWERARKIF